MDQLLSDLYALMDEKQGGALCADPAYRDCTRRHQRLLDRVEGAMGAEFAQKLWDAAGELHQLELEAAFAWGLRLGLALGRV